MMNSYIKNTDGPAFTPEVVRSAVFIFVLLVLSLGVYLGTMTYELVWDDIEIVRYIDSLVQEGGIPALVTSQFATHMEEGYVSGYYRPVILVSLWFDSLFAGSSAWFYHLTNVTLHGINTLLVFGLLWLLVGRYPAALGSMVFAVHPVHSESVAFVSGRTDLWAALFVLIAVITWVRERTDRTAAPGAERLISFAAFFLACLSKETAIMLPAVLLVWEASAPSMRQAGHAKWWIRNRTWILGWAAAIGCVVVLRSLVFGLDLGLIQSRSGVTGPGGGMLDIPQMGQMLAGYLRLLVLPWPLRIYYGPADIQLTAAMVAGSVMFVSAAIFVFYRCSKENALQAVSWIFFFLLPVLPVAARGGALLAERFLYLPSVGFCLLAGSLAAGLAVNRRITSAGIILLVALMMFGTTLRSGVWRNEVTLFSELVRTAPMAPGGHYNLANAYSARGMHGLAVQEYRQTVGIDPDHYRAFFNMGNALSTLKRYDEAVDAFRRTLAINPDFLPGYINLGVSLMESGKSGQAVAVYREGIAHGPGDLRLHLGLVAALLGQGNRQLAFDHLETLKMRDRALADIIKKTLLKDGAD